eukprot:Colp12_sorted_trinity150504_noHs@27855
MARILRSLPWFFLVLLLSSCFVATVRAEEDDEVDAAEEPNIEVTEFTEGEESDAPSNVATSILFYNFPDGKFEAGAIVKALIGFKNIGEEEIMVDTIEAAFRYPQDYRYFLQNFTARPYNTVVKPGVEQAFEYAFRPSSAFDTRAFGLTVEVNYRTTEAAYSVAAFNNTVEIYEPEVGLFDPELLFLIFGFVAFVVVGGWFLTKSLFGSKKKSKSSRPAAPVETGTSAKTSTDFVDLDYLQQATKRQGARK